MKFLNLAFSKPEENLACDEALLELADVTTSMALLRVWKSERTFVVVGYSNQVDKEVNIETCQHQGIPILRRTSGGGAVVIGQGCVNYSLVVPISMNDRLNDVSQTNQFFMEKNRDMVSQLVSRRVEIQGYTDLALGQIKFSGNAQRRKRNSILFHGTFLIDMDLKVVEKVLKFPSRQPPYRLNRTHGEFLCNLNVSANQLIQSLQKTWNVEETLTAIPKTRIDELVRQKYSCRDWNYKR